MLVSLAVSLVLAQMGGPSDPKRDFAAGDKDAALMLPPETVCGADSRRYLWTSDGASLVVRRDAADVTAADYVGWFKTPKAAIDPARARARTEIVVWSMKRRKATVALTVLAGDGNVGQLQAMPGTDRVLFGLDTTVRDPSGGAARTVHSIAMLATGTGQLVRMSADGADWRSQGEVSVSPKRPLGMIEWADEERKLKTVRFFGPTGFLGPVRAAPTGAYTWFGTSGEPGFLFLKTVGGKRVQQFQTIDPATGRLGPLAAAPPFVEKPETEKAMVADVRQPSIGGGATAPTVTLRMKGGKPEEAGVVTTDGINPLLSPKMDAIAYVSQGNLMVRQLARVPRQAYEEALAAQERIVLLSKAKQVGVAFMIYASDMDDVLPDNGADYRALIAPYLKNDSLMDGFVYSFAGGNLTGVESPAETVLGYTPGPGGRAVVYVDGHAKWIPDTK